MTREELFSVFRRPWRLSEADIGVVLCADGSEALTVNTLGDRDDEDVIALTELVCDLVNEAEE